MNYRTKILFYYNKIRKNEFFAIYKNMVKSCELKNFENVERKFLLDVLMHCNNNVPYYNNIFYSFKDILSGHDDPVNLLRKIPVLTKDIIRKDFNELHSNDLSGRKWFYNTSGGSTGEPIRLIQDWEYINKVRAIEYLYYWLVGHEIGKKMFYLWGSERDILQGSAGIKNKINNFLRNIKLMNAFRMTPESMKKYLSLLDSSPPSIVLAYAQSIYELAMFAERNNIRVAPQRTIMTSAGTLYPFMREKIEAVFRCKVFNRYGSREVGDIACEHPESRGLWVAPWGCYVEIVDENGDQVPPGTEGDILVTSHTNYAMPLIRYKIGDRGVLSPISTTPTGLCGQILTKVSGRNVDMFKCRDGTLIDGEYFTHILYFRDWVKKFQFIQKDFDLVYVNIMKTGVEVPEGDLEDINNKIRVILGNGCRIEYKFLEDIESGPSGKYRYTISEVV